MTYSNINKWKKIISIFASNLLTLPEVRCPASGVPSNSRETSRNVQQDGNHKHSGVCHWKRFQHTGWDATGLPPPLPLERFKSIWSCHPGDHSVNTLTLPDLIRMLTNTTGVLWWTQSQACASLHPFPQWPGGQIVAGWCMINGYSSTQKVIKRRSGPGGLEWLIPPNINRQFISFLLISINTQLGSGGVLKSIPAVSGWEAGI